MSAIASPIPVRRLIVMPWRWSKASLITLTAGWLLFYLISFPPVNAWLNSDKLEDRVFLDVVTAFYLPLIYSSEESEACFTLYVWELRMIAGSPWLAWMLPRPFEQDEIYPWVLNPDGSSVVESSNATGLVP